VRGPKNLDSTDRWRAIEEEFRATGDAVPLQKALTAARDESVIEAYRGTIEPAFAHGVAMLAGGAYGRGQTFPYSELDIVLLADSEKQCEALQEKLPEFVRLLWNAGLRLNPAVLTVAQCLEAVERASLPAFNLLDRRLLAGDRAVFEKLAARLPPALALHREKLRQRLCQMARARHDAHGNTPDHAEPDVKEGPGGLQDVRLVEWLALLKAEREERSGDLSRAAALVASVRCFLHYGAKCDHNSLDFESQAGLAQQKISGGQPSAGWMRAYFENAWTIFNEARRAVVEPEKSQSSLLENFREYRTRLSNQEFTVSREHLLLRNPAQLAGDPMVAFRMLEFIGRHGVPAAPDTERRLESSREAFAAFCARPGSLWPVLKTTLACPHAALALRTLRATGLMRALLPEWKAIEHLVIADSEYRYTVDEHTLRAVECLLELASTDVPERRRFAALLTEIDDVALLLFAVLFRHIGHEMARAAAGRLQMPADARGTLEFAILHQSDLSDAMSGRDLDDPATVRRLAERVGTTERLGFLALVTYAGIVGVAAEDKIPWRLDQLWRAYSVVQRELIRELETDRIQQVPENLPGNAAFVRGFPLRYLRAHSAPEIEVHMQLFERSRPTGVAVKLDPLDAAYRITVVARDKPFLFAQFAGAISSFGLDILKAEAFSNATGVVLDTFVVADPRRMLQLNPGEADRLGDLMQRIALGRTDAHKLMRGRGLPDANKRAQPPHVQFDSEACPTATLVEINTEDRPGLLYSLATVFSTNACNIDIVLVDTKGHRAIDVFYVAHERHKLSPEMQARLKEKLLAVC
jgi:[protein-PII] uridylyltransferase